MSSEFFRKFCSIWGRFSIDPFEMAAYARADKQNTLS